MPRVKPVEMRITADNLDVYSRAFDMVQLLRRLTALASVAADTGLDMPKAMLDSIVKDSDTLLKDIRM